MKKKMYATTSGLLLGGIFIFSLSGCTSMTQLTSWIPFMGSETGYFQKRHSGQVESYYRAACSYQNKNQHRRAIEEFEMVLGEDHAHAKAFNGMGVSYDQLREFKKAAGCYEAALRIDPGLDYVYNNLGYSLLMQGHVDGAIAAFRNAIALNNGNGRYHNNLGIAYSQKGEIQLAQAEFKQGRSGEEIVSEQLVEVAKDKSDDTWVRPAASVPRITTATVQKEVRPVEQKDLLTSVAALLKEQSVKQQPSQPVDTPVVFTEEKVAVKAKSNDPPLVAALPREQSVKQQPSQSVDIPVVLAEDKVVVKAKSNDPSPVDNLLIANEVKASDVTPTQQTRSVAKAVAAPHVPAEKVTPLPRREPEAQNLPQPMPEPLVASKSMVVPVERNINPAQPGPDIAMSAPTITPESAEKVIAIEVANGNGGYHTAKNWGAYLLEKGQRVSRVSNADNFHYQRTVVYYRDGYLQEAYQLAKQIPLYQNMKMVNEFENPQINIKVVIGEDMVRWDNILVKNVLLAKVD